MHPDAERLLGLDAALRAEADETLARSGIGTILEEAGYEAVGSYVMGTMTWRDLDFERYKEPDWKAHWEVGAGLAATGWPWRQVCTDHYRHPWRPEKGLYWGLRVAPPGGGETWKLDLWTARPEEFAPAAPKRELWASLMTDENRSHILAIKEALCMAPEYRKSLLSVHVYEAVLEEGVKGVDGFREWWSAKHGKGEEG
jgi:hypothetical protein